MPLQNRVTPEGEIIATEARGAMMGNRGGCFHRDDRTLGRRRWASRQWICCVLAFKGRRRQVMSPGLYTELFFLDEATALAAGHRPCFECRRDDALLFSRLFGEVGGNAERTPAPIMDRVLHAERLDRAGGKGTVPRRPAEVPDGAFVRGPDEPLLRWRGRWLPWTPAGYRPGLAVEPSSPVAMLTPPTIAAILAAGYRPVLETRATDLITPSRAPSPSTGTRSSSPAGRGRRR